ncbi:hypothetical protein KR018_001723 [Drosophila ironensis]|nr:hypothetical protein KR018_001723 [Drosophila ironensis]
MEKGDSKRNETICPDTTKDLEDAFSFLSEYYPRCENSDASCTSIYYEGMFQNGCTLANPEQPEDRSPKMEDEQKPKEEVDMFREVYTLLNDEQPEDGSPKIGDEQKLRKCRLLNLLRGFSRVPRSTGNTKKKHLFVSHIPYIRSIIYHMKKQKREKKKNKKDEQSGELKEELEEERKTDQGKVQEKENEVEQKKEQRDQAKKEKKKEEQQAKEKSPEKSGAYMLPNSEDIAWEENEETIA